jgi:hypothetical protein
MKLFVTVLSAILLICILAVSCNKGIKIRLNEDVAIAWMMKIRDAQRKYKETAGFGKYGRLDDLVKAGLLKAALNDGSDHGYRFEIRVDGDKYVAIAVPITYEETGYTSFFLNESGIIRGKWKGGEEANEGDPTLAAEFQQLGDREKPGAKNNP